MKLSGEKRRGRKPRANEVVRGLETEPSGLNERLGITPEVKAKLLGFIDRNEFELYQSEGALGENVYLDKLATAENLLILFPEERARILQAIDLEQLRDVSTHNFKKRDFWSFVLEFDPAYVEKLEVDEEELDRSLDFHRQKIQRDRKFSQVAYQEETIRLFLFLQKLFPKKYPVLPPDLKSNLVECIEGSISVGDFPDEIILAYLKTIPEDHPKFKQQLSEQRTAFPRGENALTDKLSPQTQIQLLAAAKIMLAEEIEILASGEIRGVEQGQLGKTTPLPERSLA